MEKIESKENARIRSWAKLHEKKERDARGLFLIEGEHLIGEALEAQCVDTILYDTENPFSFEPSIQVTEGILAKLSSNISKVHLIAVCHKQNYTFEHAKRILLLDGVQDPGNLGTLVRTAVSFSFDAVVCSKDCVDLYNEKTIRSTQGALFHIPVIRTDLLEETKRLQQQGFQVVATALDSSIAMNEIPATEQMAFILGNEGQGVRKELQELADTRLRIEMDGFESLNVAVAGGIILYQYRLLKSHP